MMSDYDVQAFQVLPDEDHVPKRASAVRTAIKAFVLGATLVVATQLFLADWTAIRLAEPLRKTLEDDFAFAMTQAVATDDAPLGANAARAVFVPARMVPELRGFVCQEDAGGQVFLHEYRAGARLDPDARLEAQEGLAREFCDRALALATTDR